MRYDTAYKLAIYFLPGLRYWRLNSTREATVAQPGVLGRYPIDLRPRLQQGHYDRFDDKGVPVRPSPIDPSIHLHVYTTMCSFALANWDEYLTTGDERGLKRLLAVADYIEQSGEQSPSGGLLLHDPGPDGREHAGPLCAMTQGEAMSVFVRAYEATGDAVYQDAALACLDPFNRDIHDKGVVGRFVAIDRPWYEEDTGWPLRHILNGMIYSLIGLHELNRLIPSTLAGRLYHEGCQSVEQALPLFDRSWWSNYWYAETGNRHYIASMLYHNLHIVQLVELYRQTHNRALLAAAKRFEAQSRNPINRFRALHSIYTEKRDGTLERTTS